MTREQAVKWVKFVHDVLYEDKDEEIREALNMAIEALYKPTSDDLIIKGAKGIKDGLYNIQNGELFQYKAKGGTVRAYQIVEVESEDE